jgi:hypothetical protein
VLYARQVPLRHPGAFGHASQRETALHATAVNPLTDAAERVGMFIGFANPAPSCHVCLVE